MSYAWTRKITCLSVTRAYSEKQNRFIDIEASLTRSVKLSRYSTTELQETRGAKVINLVTSDRHR